MNKIKIFIVTKDLNSRGGVASYYRLFIEKFSDSCFELVPFSIGSRPEDYEVRESRRLGYFFDLLHDLFRFCSIIRNNKDIKIVQVSPSLIPIPLLRDALFIIISRIYGRKTVVFFRGWRTGTVDFLKRHSLVLGIFKKIYFSADHCCVLAHCFGDTLLGWGLDPIKLTVTYTTYDATSLLPFVNNGLLVSDAKLIFIGRVSEAKGIMEIIEASAILRRRGYRFTVDIYGHEANSGFVVQAQRKIEQLQIPEIVNIHGYIDKEDKFRALSKADIFLLPSWFEGCPNAVVEALGAGLFTICTRVGALPELVVPDFNGSLVKVKDSLDLAENMAIAIDKIIKIRSRRHEIARHAEANFEIKVCIQQFSNIYKNLL